jgi:threonine/homoserine/homoserine lactone efflux protein
VPAAQTIARFMTAGLALNLAPGPDMLLVAAAMPPRSWRSAMVQGAGTNILNEVALFFLAFVPQFVDPGRGPAAGQIVVLGMLFNATGLVVNPTVGWLASRATGWLPVRPGPGRALQRITGGVFVALGVRLALLERR